MRCCSGREPAAGLGRKFTQGSWAQGSPAESARASEQYPSRWCTHALVQAMRLIQDPLQSDQKGGKTTSGINSTKWKRFCCSSKPLLQAGGRCSTACCCSSLPACPPELNNNHYFVDFVPFYTKRSPPAYVVGGLLFYCVLDFIVFFYHLFDLFCYASSVSFCVRFYSFE